MYMHQGIAGSFIFTSYLLRSHRLVPRPPFPREPLGVPPNAPTSSSHKTMGEGSTAHERALNNDWRCQQAQNRTHLEYRLYRPFLATRGGGRHTTRSADICSKYSLRSLSVHNATSSQQHRRRRRELRTQVPHPSGLAGTAAGATNAPGATERGQQRSPYRQGTNTHPIAASKFHYSSTPLGQASLDPSLDTYIPASQTTFLASVSF